MSYRLAYGRSGDDEEHEPAGRAAAGRVRDRRRVARGARSRVGRARDDSKPLHADFGV